MGLLSSEKVEQGTEDEHVRNEEAREASRRKRSNRREAHTHFVLYCILYCIFISCIVFFYIHLLVYPVNCAPVHSRRSWYGTCQVCYIEGRKVFKLLRGNEGQYNCISSMYESECV